MNLKTQKLQKMKKTFKCVLAIALLFATMQSFAQKEEKKERKRYENLKEKNISKTYSASGNSLSIDNEFGNVNVTAWDKNEIKVDIHIEASSSDKELADKTFERLDVKDKQEGKQISFKTMIADLKKDCQDCHSSMYIDYDIHLPASNTLSIKNSFGDIVIPDYTGTVSLNSMYGALTAGKLTHLEKLEVQFGKADLKNLSNTDVTFSYTSINIESLSGNNKIKMEFCPYSKISLDNDLTSLTLHDSYSVVHLRPVANFSASYDISTSYGSFIDKTGSGIKRTDTPDRYGPDLDKHYEGKSGSGSAKIEIKSNFGSIMIGEGSEQDMKEKKKVKS
jgi:hypothetical protein